MSVNYRVQINAKYFSDPVIGCAGTGHYRWRVQRLSCMAGVIGFEDVVEYVVTKY